MSDKIIDLASGKSLSVVEGEEEERLQASTVDNLELFDQKVSVYRDAIANGSLDSFVMCGIVDGAVLDTPYVFLGKEGCFSKTSVLLSDLQIQIESYAIADLMPVSDDYEE